jgi:hypothetical protein
LPRGREQLFEVDAERTATAKCVHLFLIIS